MDCAQVAELVTDYLEGALPAEERSRFEDHVAACLECGRHLDQLRSMIHVMGHLRAGDIPADAMRALCEAFLRTD